ncbi:hypothetical protein Sste5346_006603 [Sporothrix stenoceras]|uniref:RING-type domain-containing protein n=1 Tax=Sporothrix stenoceras TaxID=5173 RepID=A0ABR3YZ51_9PEZI
MESAFSRNRQRLAARDGYDVAFCHNCFHEWYLNEGATSPPPPCPRCEAEVVEIVEDNDNDPRGYQQPGPLPMFAEVLMGLSGLGSLARPGSRSESQMSDAGYDNHIDRNHDGRDRNAPYDPFSNPGDTLHHDDVDDALDDDMYSDPDEADIEEEEYHGPNNVYMYRSTQHFDPGDPDEEPPTGPSLPQLGLRSFLPHMRTQGQQNHHQQPPPREPPREPQPVPQREPQDPPRRAPAADPADPRAILNTFMQMMHGLGDGNRTGSSGPETLFSGGGNGNGNGNTTTRRHQTTTINTNFGTTSFTIATGPLQPNAAGNFNAVFANIMGNVGPPNVDAQNQGQNQDPNRQRGPGANGSNGTLPPFSDALQNLLAMIMGQGATAAYNGDAVHSDEALDRIITMLMENGRGPTGAPPAAQSALDELERKKVDAKMLEPDGHAECTICITEVQLDEEVLYLPCKHWFHEECVVTWLRQHNTCPVCRHALAPATNTANSSNNTSNNRSNPVPGAAPPAGGDQAEQQQQPPQPQHRPISDFLRNHRLNTSQHMTDHLRFHQEQVNRARLNAIRAAANRPTDPGPVPGSNSNNGTRPIPDLHLNPFPPGTFGGGSASPFGTASPFNTGSPFNAGSPFQQPSPSPTPSAVHTPASSSSHNASHYRSSRVPEREAAAERERRRRDSHSPTASNNASIRMRFTNSSSSQSQTQSQTDRLREQREQQQQQREQREQQQREQREHQEHIDAWMDYDEFPSAASAFSTRNRQRSSQSGQANSGQTQTQSGSGSNGAGHYFWYSSMGPTHTGMPNAGESNTGASNNTDPSPGGTYDGSSDRNSANTAHINIQLPGLSTMFSNSSHGGDPSSGGNESGPASNANNAGNSNSNGGGGFFSSLFRGFGSGNTSNARRRS